MIPLGNAVWISLSLLAAILAIKMDGFGLLVMSLLSALYLFLGLWIKP